MSEINMTQCDRCDERASKEGAKNWRHIQITDGNGYGKTRDADFCVACWGVIEAALRNPNRNPLA